MRSSNENAVILIDGGFIYVQGADLEISKLGVMF